VNLRAQTPTPPVSSTTSLHNQPTAKKVLHTSPIMATKTALPNRNGTMARTHAADVKEHTVAIAPKRRKTSPRKPEDLGLIASLSAMVCDHQIGMLKRSSSTTSDYSSLTIRVQESALIFSSSSFSHTTSSLPHEAPPPNSSDSLTTTPRPSYMDVELTICHMSLSGL
jgi:hypothetical protein